MMVLLFIDKQIQQIERENLIKQIDFLPDWNFQTSDYDCLIIIVYVGIQTVA